MAGGVFRSYGGDCRWLTQVGGAGRRGKVVDEEDVGDGERIKRGVVARARKGNNLTDATRSGLASTEKTAAWARARGLNTVQATVADAVRRWSEP